MFFSRKSIKGYDKKLTRLGFCHHKCGTVYQKIVFEKICQNVNLEFIDVMADEVIIKNIPSNAFLFFRNAKYESQISEYNLKSYKGYHIVRDPRDMIISGYFSHRYSHPIDNQWGREYLVEYRKWLNSVPLEIGMMQEIAKGISLGHMSKWNYNDKNIIEIKFEDLITNPYKIFWKILDFLSIRIKKAKLKKIIKNNSFERFSRGRKKGEEKIESHFRKGISGDWKNYFTKEHINFFKKKWGHLLIQLGYEKNNNW